MGSVPMSDGRAGAVEPRDRRSCLPLSQPYDGGTAFKHPGIATTRFSHHPSAGTHRDALRLPDADAAASYNADSTITIQCSEPQLFVPGVSRSRTTKRRGVEAPWAFTGDSRRLADAGMSGTRVHVVSYADGRREKWAGPGAGFAAGLQVSSADAT